ncbi:hypothetical protein GCM10022222_80210 [Amycolatopsis ultiminotia]|uniref:Uncharacterized protein n=1 Tax=Amycolatopsis ultiminotia TaxID=543629 RepID=A0ABP6YH28_9PSEU
MVLAAGLVRGPGTAALAAGRTGGTHPADVFDLQNWYLGLPIGGEAEPGSPRRSTARKPSRANAGA